MKVVGEGCFADCVSLTSVSFPDNLEHICSRAFIGCKNLSIIYMPKNTPVIESPNEEIMRINNY